MARSSSDFFESSSIQSSDERIEVSQFSMATLERETIERANLGGPNMRGVVAVIPGSSVQSLL